MKKIILSVAICLTFNSTFATYDRSTINGGPNGYNITSKVIDSNGNTTITCKDPGYEICPTSSNNSSEQPAIDYAIAQISNGTLTGTATIQGVTVSWRSSNRQMSNSKITAQ